MAYFITNNDHLACVERNVFCEWENSFSVEIYGEDGSVIDCDPGYTAFSEEDALEPAGGAKFRLEDLASLDEALFVKREYDRHLSQGRFGTVPTDFWTEKTSDGIVSFMIQAARFKDGDFAVVTALNVPFEPYVSEMSHIPTRKEAYDEFVESESWWYANGGGPPGKEENSMKKHLPL